MKHVHAELMMEYAKDAMETVTPWRGWEFRNRNCNAWSPLKGNSEWNPDVEYRRKPKIPTVAGIEFPDMILNFEDVPDNCPVILIEASDRFVEYTRTCVNAEDVDRVDCLKGYVHRNHESANKFIDLILPKVQ